MMKKILRQNKFKKKVIKQNWLKITSFKLYPVCLLFPIMTKEELIALALDRSKGKNRFIACINANVKLLFVFT